MQAALTQREVSKMHEHAHDDVNTSLHRIISPANCTNQQFVVLHEEITSL